MSEALKKHIPPAETGERRKVDPDRAYFDHLTPDQKALWIADHRFDMHKPDDFDLQGFPGGEDTKSAVSSLLDRVEGRLDQKRIRQLEQGLNVSVDIWDKAGLFTPEREKAGYAKPNFDTH